MKEIKQRATNGNHTAVSDLVTYICPSCSMISWQAPEFRGEVRCPFCSSGLPGYLTRISQQSMIRHQRRQQFEPLLNGSCAGRDSRPSGEHDGASPFVTEFFMVQGNGFKCMAYRNDDGKWRGAFDDEVLPGAIRVLE